MNAETELPRDGDSRENGDGVEIFYRTQWYESHEVPALGAIAYMEREREKLKSLSPLSGD